MISKNSAKLMRFLPDKVVFKIARKAIDGYLDKYAEIKVNGYENIKKVDGAKIFICNHLSNSDGFILEKVLKEDYDPTFVAGVKLSNDPVTNLGTKVVKHISIKPNTADKDAIMGMIKILKDGENLVLFPEGTRNGIEKGEKVKDGAAFFAVRTGAKVIPVGISGGEKPFKQMTIRYGKPMDFSDRDKNDKEELDKITEEIMEEIIKLSKEK